MALETFKLVRATHLRGIFSFRCWRTITTSLLVQTRLSSSIIRFGSTSASDSTKLQNNTIKHLKNVKRIHSRAGEIGKKHSYTSKFIDWCYIDTLSKWASLVTRQEIPETDLIFIKFFDLGDELEVELLKYIVHLDAI